MLDRIAEFFIFGFAPLMAGMLATPDMLLAASTALKGEVSYRERIALPPDAMLIVQLLDVSLAEAPAKIIAEQKIAPAGQVPIPFELSFNSATIKPKSDYVLRASIKVDSEPKFTGEHHDVDPLAEAPQNMMLRVAPRDRSAVHSRGVRLPD